MILLNKLFSTKKSAKGRVDYPLLLLGAVIYGVSVGLVLSPNEIAPGGASGLAVMLSRFLPLGVGSLTMAINLPLLAVSLYVFGWRFLLGTVVAIAVSGLTADMCTLFTPLTNDIFLSAIAGGILLGAGCGIVFRSGGTTGGTDIAAKLIKRKKPYMAAGQIFMLADDMCAQRFCFRQYRQRTVFVLYTVGVLKNAGYDTLRRRQRKACADNKPCRR